MMADHPGPGADSGSGSDSDQPEEYYGMEQPPLIKQLKGILSEYPDDGQIIKEIVQNAEDAGATTLKVLYDGRVLNPKKDRNKHLQLFFKGPALCFYNDALFESADWKGIRMIYSSIKEDDPLKVGRFGLGFKSVLHITDCPLIISGENVLFMNPLQRNPNMVCTMIKLSKLRRSKCLNMQDLSNCLTDVLRRFGLDEDTLEKGYCKGTIFRFPFRDAKSDLSETLYDQDKVMDLFKSFQAEAPSILLFLKSLFSIELFSMNCDSEYSIDGSFYTVEITGKVKSVKEKRNSFTDQVIEKAKTKPPQPIYICTPLTVQTKRSCKTSETVEVSERDWMVVHFYMGGNMSTTMGKLVDDESYCYSPNVGLAFPLCHDQDDFLGHVFCFLPLPQERRSLTGLPVHVNGFFALTQNRRYLKWPSADQVQFKLHMDKPIQWNTCLLSEVLPKAFILLIREMIARFKKSGCRETDTIFNCFPDVGKVEPKWKPLVDELYHLLLEKEFIFTENEGGKLIKYTDAKFVVSSNTCRMDVVKEVVLLYNQNLAEVPEKVLVAIRKYSTVNDHPDIVDSTFIIKLLRQDSRYERLSCNKKLSLLEFIMDDIRDVEGLALLPLDNGAFTTFTRSCQPDTGIYQHDESTVDLFSGQEHKFLLRDLASPKLKRQFEAVLRKDKYQVQHISAKSLARIIQETIQTRTMTQANYLRSGNMLSWLEEVWLYILKRFPNQLGSFSYLKIIPDLSTGTASSEPIRALQSLSEKIILKTCDADVFGSDQTPQLPESVCKLLESMSVVVIRTLPTWLPCNRLKDFVFFPSERSVLKLIAEYRGKLGSVHLPDSEESIAEFMAFLARGKHQDLEPAKSVLRKLKIFRESIDCKRFRFVSLTENSNVYTGDKPFHANFPEALVVVRNQELSLAMNLDAVEVTDRDLLLKVLQALASHTYSKEDQYSFMLYLLPQLQSIHRHDKELIAVAKDVKFVEKQSGNICRAMDLFDKSDATICEMFLDEDVFPVDQRLFSAKYIEGMRVLGLKQEISIQATDLYLVAKSLDTKCSSSTYRPDLLIRKATAFATILERLSTKLRGAKLKKRSLKDELSDFKWIPIVNKSPSNYPRVLPWFQPDGSLCKPCEVKSDEFLQLIGSVCPIVDCISLPNLAKWFGWRTRPTVAKVYRQLQVVIWNYRNSERHTLLEMIFQLYSDLSQQSLKEVQKKISNKSTETGFVWNGSGFCPPEMLYVKRSKDDIDLTPYVYALPEDFDDVGSFFQKVGCFEAQNMHTLCYALEHIKRKHDSESCIQEEVERDLSITLNILRKIDRHNGSVSMEEVLLPVHTGNTSKLVLKPAEACTFCNADSLEDVEFDETDDIVYVHEIVPQSLARSLGANSLTESALKLADADDWVPEEFEQDESLTTRIQSLLKAYTDGLSVPKELIQNADDAGASTIRFMYDERENRDARTHLLSSEMAECQGPALWVYNNKPFTEKDMKNIKKLNGATKESKAKTIGKFGLGFCSVYNLTDLPMFVSGQDAVIFDPNALYLPGNKKGTRINLDRMKKMKMMKRIKNQFKTFEDVFGCQLMSADQNIYFDGTLFRLPLRTEVQAQNSKLSGKAYTKQEIRTLLEMFMKTAGSFLLFSQNIKTIELYYLGSSQDPRESQCIYSATKAHIGKPSLPPVLHKAARLKKDQTLRKKALKEIEQIKIDVTASESVLHKKAMKGESNWIVSWATGTSKSVDMTLSGKLKGALPLGGIAVPIKNSDMSCVPISLKVPMFGFYNIGYIFCFLPLPIETELQVHVNGSFCVTDDRRHLRVTTSDDKDCMESDWNEAILGDAVCEAFIHALEFIRDNQPETNYCYHQLWPRKASTLPATATLQSAFYNALIRNDCKLFETKGEWVRPTQCIFLDPRFRKSPTIGQLAFDALSRLHSSSASHVMDISDDVLSILTTDHHIQVVTEKAFFETYFFPNFHSEFWLGFEDVRTTLLLHTLDTSEDYHEILMSTSCIPTSFKSTYKRPSELIDPSSPVAALFFIEDDVFPENEFYSGERLRKLRRLGMQTSNDLNELLVKRAYRIEELSQFCSACAERLSSEFVQYLSTIQFDAKIKKSLENARFLPILKKPKHWPFIWGAETENHASVLPVSDCLHRKVNGDRVHTNESSKCISFASPNSLYFKRRLRVVGCTRLVLDERSFQQDFNIEFLGKLGVNGSDNSLIEIEIILSQLLMVSDIRVELLDDEMLDTRNEVCNAIYRALDNRCRREDLSEELASLRERPVLVLGQTMVRPRDVALSLKHNCTPHLFGLDNNMLSIYKDLLRTLEVKKCFHIDDVLPILQSKVEKWKETSLPDQESRLILNLLLTFQDAVKEEKLEPEDVISLAKDSIYLPDKSNQLKRIDVLCMDDADIETNEQMCLVNPMIPEDIASLLGVKPKKKQHLINFSEPFGEPFGQHEDLVNRLKRILDGYPCDGGIMKELVQNADDAGATEIEFIKDFRDLGTDKIFDKTFEPLQGPALCVFNNSSFTEGDLEAIQKLGVGNKADDPTKTGQYGVGFNAVYHLTDAPSFLSTGHGIKNKATLCFLDPMCKFIPGATKAKPGLRISDIEAIRKTDSDVLKGYHESTYMQSGPGTLFRLSLRTHELADSSKISKQVFTGERVERLLDSFKHDMADVLLFAKNITKISIVDISTGKREVKYTVSADLSKQSHEKRRAFWGIYRSVSERFSASAISVLDMEYKEFDYEISVKIGGQRQTWMIIHRLGFQPDDDIPVTVKSSYQKGHLGLLPHGAVAVPLPELEEKTSIRMTTEQRKAQEAKHDKKAFCFLPLPVETRMPVHVHGYFALDNENRRNLLFEKGDGYKSDWNRCIIEYIISRAYVKGLELIKQKLFPEIRYEQMTWSTMNDKNNVYHSYFPIFQEAKDDVWKFLVTCVFREVISEEKNLFPVIQQHEKSFSVQWLPIQQRSTSFPAYFNNIMQQVEQFHRDNERQKNLFRSKLEDKLYDVNKQGSRIQKLVWELEKSMRAVGIILLSSPLTVYFSMKDASMDVQMMSANVSVQFLKTHTEQKKGSCKLGATNVPIQQTNLKTEIAVRCLLHYCSIGGALVDHIEGVPLLVTEDNYLRVFTASAAIFCSPFCKLLPGSKDKFVLSEHLALVDQFCEKTSVFSHLTIDAFGQMLCQTLASKYYNRTESIQWVPGGEGIPYHKWLKYLWDFLDTSLRDKKTAEQSSSHKVNPELLIEREGKTALLTDLNSLMQWSIVPATIRAQRETAPVLVSLKDAATVIDIFTFSSQESVRKAIHTMDLPVLDTQVRFRYLFRPLFASMEHQINVINCFVHHANHIKQRQLSPDDCHAVLEYLNSCLASLKNKEPNEDTLRDLLKKVPLYVTLEGHHRSLEGCVRVFALPKGFPSGGIEEWAGATKTVLLVQRESLENLHRFVGCAAESETELYIKHVLPTFQHIPVANQKEHLTFIKNRLLQRSFVGMPFSKEQNELLVKLKTVHFIHIEKGQPMRADQFYSPFEPVFKAVLDEEMFPPAPFSNEEWKEFMELTGVKTEISADMLLQYANQLSNEAREGVSDRYTQKVKTIINHMFQRKNIFNENLLSRISHVKFIPTLSIATEYVDIHKQLDDKVCAYRGSALKKSQQLVWTSCCILPKWADPSQCYLESGKTETWIKQLGISSPPGFDVVLRHIEAICNVLGKYSDAKVQTKQATFKTALPVLTSLYKYLLENVQKVALAKERMYNLPLIFFEDQLALVPPCQVVLNLSEEDEIRPYLYNFPITFGQYFELFQVLGCEQKPLAKHYCFILEQVKNSSGGKGLHVEELRVTKLAIDRLLNLWSSGKEDTHHVQCLYLPNETKVMTDATKLVVVDNIAYKHRIGQMSVFDYFLGFQELEIEVSDVSSVIKSIPKDIRPKLLSDIVFDKLNMEKLVEVEPSSLKQKIEQFLRSPQVLQGLLRIILHQQTTTDLSKIQDALSTHLKNIVLTEVQCLQTRLCFQGSVVPDSTIPRRVYLHEPDCSPKECHLYFENAYGRTTQILNVLSTYLVEILQQCTGINRALYLTTVVNCIEDQTRIRYELDDLRIRAYALNGKFSDSVFPDPGTYVPEADHDLLQQGFSTFQIGEFAAFEVFDAAVEGNFRFSQDKEVLPTYIYVKILEVKNTQSSFKELFEQYVIDIGHSRTEHVEADRLYKFTRVKREGSNTRAGELVPMVSDGGADAEEEETLPTMKEAYGIVRATLKEAWKSSDEVKRKRVAKRLMQKWHPDKNKKENETLCTKVFQYIQHIIGKLDRGEPVGEEDDEDFASSGGTDRRPPSTSDFFEEMFRRGFSHGRQHRNRKKKRGRRGGGGGGGGGSSYGGSSSYGFTHETTHLPREGQRWLRQARTDLSYAQAHLRNAGDRSDNFSWICYMCFQATEKGLKALWFIKDANRVNESTDIITIAVGLGSDFGDDLADLARQMISTVGNDRRMRYPDVMEGNLNPSDLYTRNQATVAIEIAEKVLERVSQRCSVNGYISYVIFLRDLLKKVPLYVTLEGHHRSLEGCVRVFALPKGFPSGGIEEWAGATKTVLLVQRESLENLHRFVGCAAESETELYIKHVLPTFQHIPVANQKEHLTFIKNRLLQRSFVGMPFSKEQNELLVKLKTVHFIHIEKGQPMRADQFYSPFEPVFKAVLDEEMFPPAPFSNEEWKEFMELTGVKTEISADMLLQYANQLSNEAREGVSDRYTQKVKTIINHMFQRKNIFNENLLSRISHVKFIPTLSIATEYVDIHKQLDDKVCAYRGSALKKSQQLVWTSCCILPKWADPSQCYLESGKTETWIKQLGISSPPGFDVVLRHIEAICNVLGKYSDAKVQTKQATFKTALPVLTSLYKYLLENVQKVALAKERMYNLPLIFFEDQLALVPPCQVVLNLSEEDEIRPYLYNFPITFGQYFELFQVLGCEQKPLAKHYCFILEQVKNSSGGKGLHVEELRVTKLAIDRLLNLWSSGKEDTHHVQCLYLPNETKVMTDATKLVVVDNIAYKHRIGQMSVFDYFLGFQELEIEVSDVSSVIKSIPKDIRPKLLSDIVFDKLNMEKLVEVEPSSLKQKIEQFLRSPQVLQGLLRIILHQQTTTDLSKIQDALSTHLKNIVLTEVQCLQTRLCFQGSVVPDSTIPRRVYLHEPDCSPKECHLYFENAYGRTTQILNVLSTYLVEILQQCTGINRALYLTTVVNCIEDQTRIRYELDDLRIRAYALNGKFSDSVFPDPGTYVPEADHDLLQQGFSTFQIGEFAAFEVFDAAVEGNFRFSQDKEVLPTYIYVKILEVKNTQSSFKELFEQYVIDIGHSRTEHVEADRLYKFTRVKREGSNTRAGELVPMVSDGGADAEEEETLPTMKEAYGIVRATLKEAWKSSDEVKRKRVAKRLMQKWHPDKNKKENETLCTKVFQYIQHIIGKLDRGEPVGEEDDEDFASSGGTDRRPPSTSDFFEEMFRRGFSHGRQHRNRKKKRGRRGGGGGGGGGSSYGGSSSYGFTHETTHLPREGQRWLRQARTDLSYAQAHLRNAGDRSDNFSWICYMCFQATEKGLKALWFIKDANRVNESTDIITIAVGLGSDFGDDLADLARQMISTVGNDRRMRYPDVMEGNLNPSDLYTRNQATVAIEIAEKVLERVSQRYP